MLRNIYADNAATTSISKPVLDAMTPFLTEQYGNPSSLYRLGQAAKAAVEAARAQVASAVNALPGEIFFTSGGTEADNWAVKGAAALMAKKGKTHIISTKFEHHAVLHTLKALEKEGFSVTWLDVYENGVVRLPDLKAAITENTGLVTVMFANNEIGTVQPVAEIGGVCRERGILFHTDAVQAMGQVPIDVKAQNIDMLSISGHKLHAPKGVGALFCRKGVRLPNLIEGGAQEFSRRAGTENVPSIVGLGVAVTNAVNSLEEHKNHLLPLRERLIDGVLGSISHSRLNGDRGKRLCGNANFCFEGIEGESLLLMLDAKGVCASSGSACTSGSLDPSHVLLAIGLPHEIAHGSLRLTFSDEASQADVDYILEVLPPIVQRLRDMSPLWERIIQPNKN